MTLKSKMIATISAFCLVLAMLIIGVWAAQTVKIEMGGSLTFKADDVNVRIEGLVEGAETNPNLTTLNYSAETKPTEEELATWQNNSLTFGRTDESVNDIVITIEITNLSKENAVNIKVKDTIGSSVNVTKTVERDGELYNLGETFPLTTSTTDTESSTTFTITFSVTDKTQSVSGVKYGYIIDLSDESYVAPVQSTNESLGDVSYSGSFTQGQSVTLRANFVGPDAEFLGWAKDSANGELVSDAIEYTFTYNESSGKTYYAIFQELGAMNLSYTINEDGLTATVGGSPVGEVIIASYIYDNNVQYQVTKMGHFNDYLTDFTGISIPHTIKEIGGWTFYNSGLTSLFIPNSVEKIGESILTGSMAQYVTHLEVEEGNDFYYSVNNKCIIEKETKTLLLACGDFEIPDDGSVTQIAAYAYLGNVSRESLEIPSSITKIGDSACNSFKNLREVTIYATTPPSLGDRSFSNNVPTIKVPQGCVEVYEQAAGWSSFAGKFVEM